MFQEKKLNIFANLVLVMLMSSSISQAFYTSLFLTQRLSFIVFITVVPLTFLFYLIFKNKKSTLVSCIVLAILLIIEFFIIYLITGIEKTVNWIYTYAIWFIDILNGYNDVSYKFFTYVTIIALTFIVTLFIFLFSVKFYNFYVMCILLLSIFFVQIQFNFFNSKLSFVAFIFSFLLYYFFDILKRRSTEKTYDIGNKLKYLIYIVPVCLIIIAISFLFPIKSNRIELPWLDAKIDTVISRIDNSFSNVGYSDFDYFSISSTAFGNNGSLGGNMSLNKTHVMNVKSKYSNLYLKANSKAFYNGHGWYDDNKQFIPLGEKLDKYSDKINSDSLEFTKGYLKTIDKNNYTDIYRSSKVEIEYVNLKTKSLFIPLKTNLLNFNKPQTLFSDIEHMLFFDKIQDKGFSYDLEYNNIYLNSDKFKDSLRKSYQGYNTSSSSQAKSNELSSIDVIYRKYTQLPDEVTPRVRQLAKEIIQGKENNYDKAKAVEKYLADNYPYTLKPGNPPRKKDFVDYFLFEGKMGYCTYYASAMTVLLRCIDIPARYVEGYILPPENENGLFKVTNQQAHAWVEVYFEGFGWIQFEPTSAFVANMYNDRTISATFSANMIDSGYEQYLEMMNKYRNNSSSIGFDTFSNKTETDSKNNIPLLVVLIVAIFTGIILLAFGILASINMLRFYSTLKKIRLADPNNSVLLAYNYILKVLRLQDLFIEAAETPSQFGTRVEKTLDIKGYSFNKTNFVKITNLYVSARYSNVTLQNTDQKEILVFIDILLGFTSDKMGKFKFIITRYFLGKI